MTYALMTALVIGSIGSLVLYAMWQATETKLAKAQGEILGLKQELAQASSNLDVAESAQRETRFELELVIKQLKQEVEHCEANLPSDVESVRARLQQLLSNSHSPLLRARQYLISTYGTLPYGGTSDSRNS